MPDTPACVSWVYPSHFPHAPLGPDPRILAAAAVLQARNHIPPATQLQPSHIFSCPLAKPLEQMRAFLCKLGSLAPSLPQQPQQPISNPPQPQHRQRPLALSSLNPNLSCQPTMCRQMGQQQQQLNPILHLPQLQQRQRAHTLSPPHPNQTHQPSTHAHGQQ